MVVTLSGVSACCHVVTPGTVWESRDYTPTNDVSYFLQPGVNNSADIYTAGTISTYAISTCIGSPSNTSSSDMSINVIAAGGAGVVDVKTRLSISCNERWFQHSQSIPNPSPDLTFSNSAFCGTVIPPSCFDTPIGTGGTIDLHFLTESATLSGATTSFTNAGGSGSVTITCAGEWWAARGISGVEYGPGAPSSWLTLTSATTGSGNGSLSYTVAANGTGSSRTAKIFVNDHSVTISQAA